MTENDFDIRRARLNREPEFDKGYSHGDFYRDVIRRPKLLTKFQRWMIRPWKGQ